MTAQEHPIHYIEIVTPDIDNLCTIYTKSLGIQFSSMVPELGNAKVSELPGGITIGIRAPMHETETPVVRTYLLVNNLENSVKEAAQSGANILLDRMEIPGRGIIAIYEIGGIQQGLWQIV